MAHLAAIEVATVPLFAVWWFTPQTINSAINTALGVVTTLVLAYLTISKQIEARSREKAKADQEAKREQDKADVLAEVERIRLLDEARKDSLSAQLEEVKAQAEKATKDSEVNQRSMRKTLHDIREDLQKRTSENELLRDDLHVAHNDLTEVSRQLVEAHRRIANMTNQLEIANSRLEVANTRIAKLTTQVELLSSGESKRNQDMKGLVDEVHATMKSVTDSAVFPTYQPPQLPPPT